MNKPLRAISFILLISVSAVFFACAAPSDTPTATDVTAIAAESESPAETEFVYEYPELDCEDEDFIILNSTTTWGFYTYIDFENLTGDILNDAVFNRNAVVENQYKVNLSVIEQDIDTAYSTYQKAVFAGEDAYDIAYCRGDKLSSLILGNYLYNLYDIPEMRLDREWWDQMVINASVIGAGGELYFTASDFQLFGFDATVCTFFNEKIAQDLNITFPYEQVREGKWTLDVMQSDMKVSANLNGDTSFAWSSKNNATYGLTSWGTCSAALIYGGGETYIAKDEQNIPYLALDNDHFYTLAQKIGDMLAVEGEFLLLNNSGEDHYEMVFKAGRAFMLIAQLKASSKYRDMEDSYGILPMPKYDEAQESYICYRTGNTLLLSVPVTNADTTRTGIITDTFAYLSRRDVLPVYYDLNVSQKGLRNDESIEMLALIRDSRYFDISRVYGWCDSLYSTFETKLTKGDGNLASTVASNRKVIDKNIQKTLDLMGE